MKISECTHTLPTFRRETLESGQPAWQNVPRDAFRPGAYRPLSSLDPRLALATPLPNPLDPQQCPAPLLPSTDDPQQCPAPLLPSTLDPQQCPAPPLPSTDRKPKPSPQPDGPLTNLAGQIEQAQQDWQSAREILARVEIARRLTDQRIAAMLADLGTQVFALWQEVMARRRKASDEALARWSKLMFG